MLTKVKLRQKPLADGKLSLYLDFYSNQKNYATFDSEHT